MNPPQKILGIIYGVIFFCFFSKEVSAQIIPTVTSISPNVGINCGTISVIIIGSGFMTGATVSLTKAETSIIGSPTTIQSETTITTTFNIKNAHIGSLSVVVTNPNGKSGTLTDGFKVIPQLLINEVYYDTPTEDDEFIEIYNNTPFLVNLSGYKLSDTEGTHTFSPGSVLPAYATITIARKGTVSYASFGKKPDFEFVDTDTDIPDMFRIAGKNIQLSNDGDEVILLDNINVVIDVVTYKAGTYTGVIAHAGVAEGHSIERGTPTQDTDDCRIDFIDRYPPTPNILRSILVIPATGTVGSLVTISGEGFFDSEVIGIDFGTTSTIVITTTDTLGSFSTTFTATLQPNFGTITVSAKGLTSKAKVSTEFNLISLPLLRFNKYVTPSGTATPGATLTYTLSYKNIGLGTATNVVLIDAIPAGTIYITNSASGENVNISYSHDGGLTYDSLQDEPVTHIRWELNRVIPPQTSGNVSFKVKVK